MFSPTIGLRIDVAKTTSLTPEWRTNVCEKKKTRIHSIQKNALITTNSSSMVKGRSTTIVQLNVDTDNFQSLESKHKALFN